MSLVFQNIDPHLPHRPASVYPLWCGGGGDTLAGWRKGWGVNILEDARHRSVLYKCQYFVGLLSQKNKMTAKSVGFLQCNPSTRWAESKDADIFSLSCSSFLNFAYSNPS
jgi:hypothetical protein